MPEWLFLCKKPHSSPISRLSRATIRSKKVPNQAGIRRLSIREGEIRQPGVGLFCWFTLTPNYEAKTADTLCVEFAVKYEAAVTLQVRPSPRQ
jgi:hypothetical protein